MKHGINHKRTPVNNSVTDWNEWAIPLNGMLMISGTKPIHNHGMTNDVKVFLKKAISPPGLIRNKYPDSAKKSGILIGLRKTENASGWVRWP